MQFGQLKRREFITLLGGTAAWPIAARAQPTGGKPKIGFLHPGPVAMVGSRVQALLQGLRTAGYGGPEQVEIVLRTTDGDPMLIAPFAAEIIERNVDVILAVSSVSASVSVTAGSRRAGHGLFADRAG